jgi:predicted AlkP superfamily pyrophosphatase or phosphodiesterase
MKKKIVIVVNAVGLSPALLERKDLLPRISNLAAEGTYRPMEPSFPALTSSVQATLLSGKPPADHGIVGNGWFFRDSMRPEFWRQENGLVRGPRIFDIARERDSRARVAVLFWQNSKYIDADVVISPSPLHAGNRLVEWCYSKPPGLYEELSEKIGPFNLSDYWGPLAGEGSSQWISSASLSLLEGTDPPDMLLAYLPHLDYVSQRHGPDSAEALDQLPVLDGMVGRFIDFIEGYGRSNATLFVVSEYGLVPVLREANLLSVREIGGGEYIDFELSQAFAVVDHQIAHIYCRDPESENRAQEVLSCVEGVASVLDGDGKQALEVNHPRSGDLILLAETDSWFHYKYWAGDSRAPFFAGSVDIHNKPGYDPCELFFDPASKAIPTDPALVKGSHGLPPEGRREAQAVMVCSDPSLDDYTPQDFKATQFLGMLYRVM